MSELKDFPLENYCTALEALLEDNGIARPRVFIVVLAEDGSLETVGNIPNHELMILLSHLEKAHRTGAYDETLFKPETKQ